MSAARWRCWRPRTPSLLAGGQSLIPLMNLRRVRPAIVVDLNAIADLAFVEASPGELRIGAMTRQAELEHSTIVAEGWPLLSAAVARVGHAATRSRGTVGGSVAFGDPRANCRSRWRRLTHGSSCGRRGLRGWSRSASRLRPASC